MFLGELQKRWDFLVNDKFEHTKIPLNVGDGTGSYDLCEGRSR